jgi:hypothetical protein
MHTHTVRIYFDDSGLTFEWYHRSRIGLPPEGTRTTAFVRRQHTHETHHNISNHAKTHPDGLYIRMEYSLELVDLESGILK